MPLINTTYQPSFLFKSTHVNTMFKTLFYSNKILYKRSRITTEDDDFLDIDFSTVGSDTIVIALHGLEGSSTSKYIVSLVHFLNSKKIDVAAVNFRGCSGEDNKQIYSYNSGKTDDLNTIIYYILNNFNYKNIILVGYSMGGNITLKYLGETKILPSQIKGAITISVPVDLEGSSNALSHWQNKIYIQRFLISLIKKSLVKQKKHPNSSLNTLAIKSAKNFIDFDNAVTAPLFGYKDAHDYWAQCSSKQFLQTINVPTLLINALDDTFLSESCYPFKEAALNKQLFFETPKYGGHVGFNSSIIKKDILWSENRILEFINQLIS
ncbi:YheT family hydrolase [Lutibacter sp.]|uniref:YheT family hydrolase n=1 Tax=Lutibacter sp. TaxID=1925666 RepID=UPI003568BAD4